MASSLRKPETLSFEGNVSENLRRFFLEFDVYVQAAYPKANGATKVGIMRNLAGIEAIERSQAFEFENDEARNSVENWKQKFRELCTPMRNLIIIRHGFNSRMQKQEESFQSFLTDIRNRAEMCEFGDMKDSLLRDHIVIGICNEKTRNTLFAEPDLTLARAIELCNLHEGAEKATAMLKKETDICVLKTGRRKHFDKHDDRKSDSCKYCGSKHEYGRCPAYGKECNNCGKRNHFEKVCRFDRNEDKRSPKINRRRQQRKPNQVEELDRSFESDFESNNYIIETIEQPGSQELNVKAKFESNSFDLKVDTGAMCNVISIETIKKFGALNEKVVIKSKNRATLETFSFDKIETIGTCELNLCIAGKTSAITFQVVKIKTKPLIGLRDALKFGLIKLHPSLCVTRERNVKSAEKQATSVGLCRKSFKNKANNRSTICTIRSNSQSETSILKREYSDEARTDNNTTTQKATYAEMVKNGKKKQPKFELKHFKKK